MIEKELMGLWLGTLASKAPVPGGGGASALGGSVAAALGQMVSNLTIGKKKYADVEEEVQELLGKLQALQNEFLDLADQGMAVTFISSEVEEMLRTCSRMAVLRDGEKVGELEESELSQSNIMKAIAGGDYKNE